MLNPGKAADRGFPQFIFFAGFQRRLHNTNVEIISPMKLLCVQGVRHKECSETLLAGSINK